MPNEHSNQTSSELWNEQYENGYGRLMMGEREQERCQVAARSEALNARFGTRFLPGEEDGLALAEVATISDLERFRRKAHPMCRFCDNDKLAIVDWGRSKCAPEEWLVSGPAASTRPSSPSS